MSKKNQLEVIHERSLAKGLLAGLIGGLVATAAKTYAERLFPPRTAERAGASGFACAEDRRSQVGQGEGTGGRRGDPLGVRRGDWSGVWSAGRVLSRCHDEGWCGFWHGAELVDPWDGTTCPGDFARAGGSDVTRANERDGRTCDVWRGDRDGAAVCQKENGVVGAREY